MRALVPDALAGVEQSLRPASRNEIVALITRLAAHFPVSDRSEAQWRIVIEDYAEDLAEYPSDILRAAVTQYRREGKWWPKVSEIRALADPELGRRQSMRHRLRVLAATPVPEPEPARDPAAVARIVAGLAESLRVS